MGRLLQNILLASTIAVGSLGIGCGSTTTILDNRKNPAEFYAYKEDKGSIADFLATTGSILGVTADNEEEAALGVGLATFGTLKSNKEAAREGKAEVTVNVQPAVADATFIPEYNLPLMNHQYRDGHLIRVINKVNSFLGNPWEKVIQVDGIQNIFTYNRKLDREGDGFSFDEYVGVKKNFRRGEFIEACVGVRESAMKIKRDKNTPEENFSEKKPTHVKLSLKLIRGNDQLISTKEFESSFIDYSQTQFFFWALPDSLPKGTYTILASYTDDFNSELNRRRLVPGGYVSINQARVFRFKNDVQEFQILP